MKNRLSFLLLVSALISCSESEMEDAGKSISREALATAEQMNHVSNGDVLALTQAQSKTTRAKSESYTEIECITSKSSDTLLNAGSEMEGHCFIADRYKTIQQVIKNTYFWVWDVIPPLTPLPVIDDKIEYTYSSPTITMIGMNWGWGYNSYSEWYSPTGDWIKGNHNWNINRKMVYGFQVLY